MKLRIKIGGSWMTDIEQWEGVIPCVGDTLVLYRSGMRVEFQVVKRVVDTLSPNLVIVDVK